MNTNRTGAILMAALLLVSAVAPAAVTARTGGSVSLDVTQDETGAVVITVTANGTAVENATVSVTAAANDTYADVGEYNTDADGTVSLSEPTEPTTVTVGVTANGSTVSETVTLEPALGVDVSGTADGSVVVTVTRGNDTVENATVNVTANTTDADTGGFETDANGTVTLDNPEGTVELTITATEGNDTASATVLVEPVRTLGVGVEQADDGTVTVSVGEFGEPVANATVTVSSETYAAAGEYETDETGTVVLPAPSENVTVAVTATDESDTASTTVELEPPEPVGPFGQIVSAFVDALKGAGFTGIGSQVSDFVTSNNPSNAGNSEAVANDAPVAPPAAGNDAPVAPPGQEQKNDSRIAPAGPPAEDPGNSGSAPGQSGDDAESDEDDDAPGNSGSAPGQSGDDAESDEDAESGEEPDSDEEPESDEEDGSDEEPESDEEDESDANAGGNGNDNGGGNDNGR